MKTITLTPTEYLNCFKTVVTFFYILTISKGMIKIEAEAELLEHIGY